MMRIFQSLTLLLLQLWEDALRPSYCQYCSFHVCSSYHILCEFQISNQSMRFLKFQDKYTIFLSFLNIFNLFPKTSLEFLHFVSCISTLAMSFKFFWIWVNYEAHCTTFMSWNFLLSSLTDPCFLHLLQRFIGQALSYSIRDL